jgi:amino acid transporter
VIGSLGVSLLLYCGVAAAVTLMVPFDKIDINSPMASVFQYNGLTWIQVIVSLGGTHQFMAVEFF